MKHKPYIQVGDAFFKVILTNDGTNLEKVKAEEAIAQEMEKIILSDVEELEVSMFQDIIDNARNELKKTLEQNLKGTVLRSLGFEKDSYGGGGYRVDHCNGRMSAVTDLLSNEIRERILNVEIGKDFDITDSEKKELKNSMEKEFKDAYTRQVRNLVYNKAETLAAQHVNEFVKDLMKDKIQTIATVMLEKTVKNTK
jgi:uncharacterized protein (DUF1697 family)